MREEIKNVVAETLNVDPVSIKDVMAFEDIPEWDSMMFIMILSELEERLKVSIPLEEAMELKTMADLYTAAGILS